jgi:hypothetical protein
VVENPEFIFGAAIFLILGSCVLVPDGLSFVYIKVHSDEVPVGPALEWKRTSGKYLDHAWAPALR